MKPERRWKNGLGYKENGYFYAAIQKYGWHSFRHDILYTDLSQRDAEQMEIKLIAEYGTLESEKGYNLDPGGGVRMPTLESRKRMSEAHKGQSSPNKGKKASLETRAKLSAAKKGKPPHNKGKKASPETRAKLSASHKGKRLSPETRQRMSESRTGDRNKRRVAVICIETAERFDSLNEAGAAKNANPDKISLCCRGKQKTAGGYHWEYADTPIFDT